MGRQRTQETHNRYGRWPALRYTTRMFRLIPKDEKYFDLFQEMASCVSEATKLLSQLFADAGNASAHGSSIRTLVQQSDQLSQSVIEKLYQSFITPIDREDIYELKEVLDAIIHLVESVSARFSAYKLPAVTDIAKSMVGLAYKMTVELSSAIKKVGRGHSADASLHAIRLFENEAEILHRQALGDLFQSTNKHTLQWKDLYDALRELTRQERCLGSLLEKIVLKHS